MSKYNPYKNLFFYYRGPSSRKVDDEPDKQIEDNTTKALINTLSNSEKGLLKHFLNKSNIAIQVNDNDNVDYDLQISKDESRPDASIKISQYEVCIESKIDSPLRKDQINKHLQSISKGFLICITPRKNDITITHQIDKSNLKFITWKDIYIYFQNYVAEKDQTKFVLAQFLEYLEAINMSPFNGWDRKDFEAFLYIEDDPQEENRIRVKKKLEGYLKELKEILNKEKLYVDLEIGGKGGKLGRLDREHIWGVLAKPDIKPINQPHFSFILNSDFFSIGIQIEGTKPSKKIYQKIKSKENVLYNILTELEGYNFIVRNRYNIRVQLWDSYEVANIRLGKEAKENDLEYLTKKIGQYDRVELRCVKIFKRDAKEIKDKSFLEASKNIMRELKDFYSFCVD